LSEQIQTNELEPRSRYTSVIKFSSWAGGAIAAIISVFAFFVLMVQGEGPEAAEQIGRSRERSPIAGLIMLPVGGYMLGMALAVLFAPTSYLLSEEGKAWMEKVGVKNVRSARIVSFIFVLFGIAFLTFFTLALLTDDFKKPLF
jgi:hypothetical protein